MKNVLILEDEPLIGIDLQYAFEDRGVDAVLAVDCEEALQAIAETPFDGAVLDVNLGRGKTCEEAAVELHGRKVPFILNTGDLDRAGEFLRKLDAPVVAKPTMPEDVVEELARLVERKAGPA